MTHRPCRAGACLPRAESKGPPPPPRKATPPRPDLALELACELVRLSPVEMDVPRLLDLCYAAEALWTARHGRPLLGLEFVRTHTGLDCARLHDALAAADATGRVRLVLRPSFTECRVMTVRPGHAARPADPWQVRALAATIVDRWLPVPRSRLHARVLSTRPVRDAAPGVRLAGSLRL